jgi:hypothetical protein
MAKQQHKPSMADNIRAEKLRLGGRLPYFSDCMSWPTRSLIVLDHLCKFGAEISRDILVRHVDEEALIAIEQRLAELEAPLVYKICSGPSGRASEAYLVQQHQGVTFTYVFMTQGQLTYWHSALAEEANTRDRHDSMARERHERSWRSDYA